MINMYLSKKGASLNHDEIKDAYEKHLQLDSQTDDLGGHPTLLGPTTKIDWEDVHK